jgi:DNA primase catalytic subunit
MGIIREPKGVDFIIQSPPLTDEERKEISDFIKMRKLQRKAEKETLNKNKTRAPKTPIKA